MTSLAHRQRRARDAAARPLRYPIVYASISEPCGDRTRWLIVTSACPFACRGGRHVHYAHTLEQAGGTKRAGCGRGMYWVAVARVYRLRPVSTEVAA